VPGCDTVAGGATLHRQATKVDRIPSQFNAENHRNPHKVNGRPPNVCSFCQNVHRVHSNPNQEVGAARPKCNLPPLIQFDVVVGALEFKSRPLPPIQPFRAKSVAWYEYPPLPIQSNKVFGVTTPKCGLQPLIQPNKAISVEPPKCELQPHRHSNEEVDAKLPKCKLPPPIQFKDAVGASEYKFKPPPMQPCQATNVARSKYPPIESNREVGAAQPECMLPPPIQDKPLEMNALKPHTYRKSSNYVCGQVQTIEASGRASEYPPPVTINPLNQSNVRVLHSGNQPSLCPTCEAAHSKCQEPEFPELMVDSQYGRAMRKRPRVVWLQLLSFTVRTTATTKLTEMIETCTKWTAASSCFKPRRRAVTLSVHDTSKGVRLNKRAASMTPYATTTIPNVSSLHATVANPQQRSGTVTGTSRSSTSTKPVSPDPIWRTNGSRRMSGRIPPIASHTNQATPRSCRPRPTERQTTGGTHTAVLSPSRNQKIRGCQMEPK
jgi:hypothetical protein